MSPQVICSQRENLGNNRSEMTLWEESDHVDGLPEFRGRPMRSTSGEPGDCGCCRTREEVTDHIAMGNSAMESLSYSPVRYDANSTIDAERSHTRYSKIVVHSSRARTQKRSKVWEEWLRGATVGRSVTLLQSSCLHAATDGEDVSDTCAAFKTAQATYHVDRAVTKLFIIPAADSCETASQPITVSVDSIQVICALTDFVLLSDVVGARLGEEERTRAVLLQFKADDDGKQQRVCFLECSQAGRDQFVQALTALWLERRNDHSMWF